MPRRSAAALLTALALSACAGPRQPPAPAREDLPASVPAGVKPLTVEQEEDSAALLRGGLPSAGAEPS